MNGAPAPVRHMQELDEIRLLGRPLAAAEDLDALVRQASVARYVCIGEASHGTREYYHWRAVISRRLIEEHGFTWIGVEGDWPDCWRINRWVRGQEDQALDAYQLLAGFERWPTCRTPWWQPTPNTGASALLDPCVIGIGLAA